MDNDIPEIKELLQQFSKLPGLGPKSAKRIILKLINNKQKFSIEKKNCINNCNKWSRWFLLSRNFIKKKYPYIYMRSTRRPTFLP